MGGGGWPCVPAGGSYNVVRLPNSAEDMHELSTLSLWSPTPLRCSFLLAITQFVVPTFAFVKSRPIPFVTHELALTGKRLLLSV